MTKELSKLKVAFVINDFLVGGAQRLTADIITRLDPALFDPLLVTLFEFPERDTMYTLLPAGCPVYRLRFTSFANVQGWIALRHVLRAERPQVIVSNLFFSNTVTRIIGCLLGVPVITVEHNTYIHKTRLQRWVDRVLAGCTHAIVAVSPTVRTFTIAQENLLPELFRVIRNGVDFEALKRKAAGLSKSEAQALLGLSTSRRYIVAVGRLTPQKNIPLLLQSFGVFRASHPEYELLVVGGGGMRASLEDQVRRLGISEYVHFVGSQSEVVPYYLASEFFVSTSDIEGFGLAHAEALACGLPVVSTKTAGPDEMIEEGENGFFITEETPEGVAAALKKMIHAEPRSMREAAERTASRYDIQKTVRAYEELIAEAARRA